MEGKIDCRNPISSTFATICNFYLSINSFHFNSILSSVNQSINIRIVLSLLTGGNVPVCWANTTCLLAVEGRALFLGAAIDGSGEALPFVPTNSPLLLLRGLLLLLLLLLLVNANCSFLAAGGTGDNMGGALDPLGLIGVSSFGI